MEQTWGIWEDRPGGKANPVTRTGMGLAVGIHSQTRKNGLCFVLHFSPLCIIFNGYLNVVLYMPLVAALQIRLEKTFEVTGRKRREMKM